MIKGKISKKAMMLGLVAAGVSTAAYAVTYTADTNVSFSVAEMNDWLNVDIENGGVAVKSNTNDRNWTFTTTSQSASRAELRRKTTVNPSMTTIDGPQEVIGGLFKLNSASTSARVSIIQALNVSQVGQLDGAAYPAAQLIVKRDSAGKWRFYVNQDQSATCGSFEVSTSKTYDIRVLYKEGDRPTFRISEGGVTVNCKMTGGSTAVVGEGGRNYYGKLGGYTTSTGAGTSSVTWNNVYD